MYEARHQKPIPRRHFVRRLIMHGAGSLALIAFSLGLGMLGYHYYEDEDQGTFWSNDAQTPIRKMMDSFGLLEGLNEPVQQKPIEASIAELNAILMVLVKGVHGTSSVVRYLEHTP